MAFPQRTKKLSPSIDVCVETIDRESADRYLATMQTNRRLNQNVVNRYVKEMLAGNWRLHGQGIQFDTNGHLIDGQHRLAAISQSGRACDILVVRGVDPQIANVVDTGRKRTAADQLYSEGCKSATVTASALSLLYQYKNGLMTQNKKSGITNENLVVLWRENPKINDSHSPASAVFPILLCGTAVFCHYLFSQINEEDANQFFTLLATGAGMEKNHPVLVLRNRLLEARMAKHVQIDRIWATALTIKAWNAFRAGENLGVIKWLMGTKDRAGEAFPIAK